MHLVILGVTAELDFVAGRNPARLATCRSSAFGLRFRRWLRMGEESLHKRARLLLGGDGQRMRVVHLADGLKATGEDWKLVLVGHM